MEKRQLCCEIKQVSNRETQVLVEIAKYLHAQNMVNSFRDFSKNWMNKNSNYMNNLLFNQATKPSVASMVDLLSNLRNAPERDKIGHKIDELCKLICWKVINLYRRGGGDV